MKNFHIIGIVGLGLIGGSLALALKANTQAVVYGFDRDASVLESALHRGAIDRADGPLSDCDAVFVALYPQAAVQFILSHLKGEPSDNQFRRQSLVVDLCGVKRMMDSALADACRTRHIHYIGAHPMAGREVSGFDNASPSLYEGASLILTPDDRTDPIILKALEELMRTIGFGAIVHTSPEHHDRMIAYTSQLAHILSSSYIQNPLAEDFTGFTGGSFQDLTRVSRLSSDMWGELFLSNRDLLMEQMDILIDNLEHYKQALAEQDAAALWRLMESGTNIKNKLLSGSGRMTSE